jgi:hypothetical protein
MTIGDANSSWSVTRVKTCWKVEREPTSGVNCFGRLSRDTGHKRVPAPPHIMTGVINSIILKQLPSRLHTVTASRIAKNKQADGRTSKVNSQSLSRLVPIATVSIYTPPSTHSDRKCRIGGCWDMRRPSTPEVGAAPKLQPSECRGTMLGGISVVYRRYYYTRPASDRSHTDKCKRHALR